MKTLTEVAALIKVPLETMDDYVNEVHYDQDKEKRILRRIRNIEWAGKLSKTLNINISSPFENWMKLQSNQPKLSADIQDAEVAELQDRTADNSREAVEEEFAQLAL